MRAIANRALLVLHCPCFKTLSSATIMCLTGWASHSSSSNSTQYPRIWFCSKSQTDRRYCSVLRAISSSDNVGGGRSGALTPPLITEVLQKIDVNPPKGTRDFPPEEMRMRNLLFGNFREVSSLFGFEKVDFPVLESEALFIRNVGEEIRDQIEEIAVLH